MPIPTVLIGLGGTGSKIVNTIAGKYKTLDQKTQDKIPAEFIAIDTDINDIDKINNLDPNSIFQISTRLTVGEYVELHGPEIASWFPVDERDLYSKSLLDGAGQIRIFSRLALHAKMRDKAFQQNLHDCINKVTRLAHGQLANMRIYLVGSFSGGTGSGIFPALSVWLAKELAIHRPVIKGIIFMPDIYVTAYNLPANHHENLRTNGYAAVKELETILRNQAGLADKELTFDYNPAVEDKTIPQNEQIYNLIYLIDYETSKGGNISKDHTEYENMAVHGIFNQLFSPIGRRQLSTEDNNIIDRIVSSREHKIISNYSTFGVAACEYPYEDILLYLAKRFSIHSLSSKWLVLDEEFRKAMRDYHTNLKTGHVHLQEPRLEMIYKQKLETLATLDRDYYFYRVYDQVKTTRPNERGERETIDLVQSFIDSSTDFLDRHLESDAIFQEKIATVPRMDQQELKNQEGKTGAIDLHDNILREANLNRDQPVFVVASMVLRTITRAGEEKLDGELQSHMLQYYIRKNAPHPLAVRYFIYDLMLRLEEEIESLNFKVHSLRSNLEKYFEPKAYFDPATNEESKESNSERMSRLQNQGTFKRLLSREYKNFLIRYTQAAESQRKNTILYVKEYARLHLFQKLSEFLKTLASEYELFFQAIPAMVDTITREVHEMESYHDTKEETSFIHFILASAKAKQSLWENYAANLTMEDSDEISRQLNEMIYDAFMQKRDKTVSLSETIHITDYEGEFVKLIIPFNVQLMRRDLASQLDFDAATALLKEADWEHTQDAKDKVRMETHRTEKIITVFNDLRHRADGYLRYEDATSVGQMLLFGMHEKVHEVLKNNIPNFSDILRKDPGDEGVTESFFSKYIIQAYRIQYGIGIANASKFAYPAGSYYASYHKRIRKINEAVQWQDEVRSPSYFSDDQFKKKEIPPHIVPHIDKNWHKSAIIAEISRDEQQRFEQDFKSAAILSMIYDFIEITENKTEVTLTRNMPDLPRVTKHISRSFKSPLLHLRAFIEQNPGLIETILDASERQFLAEHSALIGKIEKYTIDKQFNEIKARLITEIIAVRGDWQQQQILFDWIKQLIILFRELVLRVLTEDAVQKEKYFQDHLNFFRQKRDDVTQFNDDEYKEFEHICDGFVNRA